jgi:hypothetical protein
MPPPALRATSPASGEDNGAVSYRVPLALIVVLLAILGAVLHPLALVLGLIPFDTSPLLAKLLVVRETIADLMGWRVLALVAVGLAMAWHIVAFRLPSRPPPPAASADSMSAADPAPLARTR